MEPSQPSMMEDIKDETKKPTTVQSNASFVESKSLVIKRPALPSSPIGSAVKLSTNFYKMQLKTSNYVYVYAVSFEESIDEKNTPLRKKIVRGMIEILKPIFKNYIFTGTLLYSPVDVGSAPQRFQTAESDIKYTVQFLRAHVISLQDITTPNKDPKKAQTANQFFNILVKSLLSSLNMVPVGRTGKYLLPTQAKQINDYNLQIWPGYKTSVNLLEGGLLLEVDYTSRILSQKSALDELRRMQKYPETFQAEAKEFFTNKSVVAWYGNKRNYVISDVDFEKSPEKYSIQTPEGPMTLMEYYKKKYGIEIKYPKQPLLLHKKEYKDKPAENIYLVPEICGTTGLPEDMRSDFRAMKQIAEYTKLTPDQRTSEMQKLLKQFSRMDVNHERQYGDLVRRRPQPQPAEILKEWGVEINPKPVEIIGRVLPSVNITLGDKQTLHVPANGQFMFKQHIVKPLNLDKWFLIHDSRGKEKAKEFVDTLYTASKTFGINVEYPQYSEIKYTKADDYIRAINDLLAKYKDPQIVVCILSRNAVNEYHKIKAWAISKANPPLKTQMIKLETLERAKNLMPICGKIALQINAKRNGDLWKVGIPKGIPAKSMMVGVDVSREKGDTYLGFASSYDPGFTRYYTQIMKMDKNVEICKHLGVLLVKSLDRFFAETSKKFFPELIVIYRDGVGDSQRGDLLRSELQNILDALPKAFPEYHPKIIYATVNKKVHTRFFSKENGGAGGRGGRRGQSEEEKGELSNPAPGTVVHSDIVDSSKYEFLMMPQYVNQGTGTPVRVQVLYDTSGLPFNTFEELSNALCYAYDNWQGAIRTPAPCKYALSHAKLAAKYTKTEPAEALLSYKYFL